MKKIIALVLAMLVVIGMFAGCTPSTTGPNGPGVAGDVDKAPYPVDEEGNFIYGDTFKDTTVEWWVKSNYDISGDSFFFKKLEEVIGCKINVTRYEPEQFTVKMNAAIQSNRMPDIIVSGLEHAAYNVYGEQGAFVNFLAPENIVKMPHLAKVLENEEIASQVEFYKSENGGLYGSVTWDHNRLINHGWMYRKDIFEKHGIEMWTDSESFLDVLRQLKQLYPDSYPLTGATMRDAFGRVVNNYGINYQYNAYDWEKKEWYLGSNAEGFYETLMVFQTAWNEGLCDPDMFTNKVGDIDTAILNGTSFVYNSWIGRMDIENKAGKAKDPTFQVSYAPQIGDGKANQQEQVNVNSLHINAQSASDVRDACMAIFDYLYSEEGIFLSTIGEEGVTFDTVDGKRVYKNADGTPMENPTIQTLEEQFGLWNTYRSVHKESVYFTFTAEEAEAQEIGSKGGFLQAIPAANIPTDKGAEYADLADGHWNSVNDFAAKFVTNNLTKADWEKQCAEWEKQYGRYIDILNGK